MFTYFLKCDVEKAREVLDGNYRVVELGGAVRLVESFIAFYAGDMPLCMYKSWRMTYADVSQLGLAKAEVLVRKEGLLIRLVRPDEKLGLPELVEGSPFVIHAMDVNENGVIYRVFRIGGYVELVAKGVAGSIKEAFHPKKGVNILIVDLPLMPKFQPLFNEVIELSREHYVELHTTMISDVCPLCGGRMEKRGRLVRCPTCKIQLNRDVNAVWALARNIVRRLGREQQLAELREIFRLYYPNV
ncbi:zinc ribbon domain-containing protein [Pyrobaculum aerophilum]|uniref:zinc ribbon domain-containing protein n=1 Tax=Pyrobaculum aerophilum TaxID=13773 RepID=UPI0023F36A08|nr:zinc ribbon domain-containing protein [Pyrobaculum aerophilum]MCX8136716.1 transposase [Pyrobaculum aerophilum]